MVNCVEISPNVEQMERVSNDFAAIRSDRNLHNGKEDKLKEVISNPTKGSTIGDRPAKVSTGNWTSSVVFTSFQNGATCFESL